MYTFVGYYLIHNTNKHTDEIDIHRTGTYNNLTVLSAFVARGLFSNIMISRRIVGTLYITQIFRKTRNLIISYEYGVVRPWYLTHTHKTYTKLANWFITLIMGIIMLWVNILYISIVIIIDHWSCAVVDHISANSLASFGYKHSIINGVPSTWYISYIYTFKIVSLS